MNTQEPYIDNAPQDPYLRHADGEPFMSYYVARLIDDKLTRLSAENRLLRNRIEELKTRRDELKAQLSTPGRCACGHLNESCDRGYGDMIRY